MESGNSRFNKKATKKPVAPLPPTAPKVGTNTSNRANATPVRGRPPTPPPPPTQHREQDQYLPMANVIRLMRKVLPPHAKISDEAKDTIQESVSEFISFISGEANQRCQQEHRKTITGEDLIWALDRLGFDNYVDPLSLYLKKYREVEGTDRVGLPYSRQNRLGPQETYMGGPSHHGPTVGVGVGLVPMPTIMPTMSMSPNIELLYSAHGPQNYFCYGSGSSSSTSVEVPNDAASGDKSSPVESISFNPEFFEELEFDVFDSANSSSSPSISDTSKVDETNLFDPANVK